jgi:hypothetical protein
MNQSIKVGNKKKARQKPPRNLGRIACEIMAGAAAGAALAFSSLYVVGYGSKFAGLGEGCMDGLFVLAILFYVVPPVYVLGCAIGVYLVGRRGNETGSLLATLGGSLLGVFVIGLLYFYIKAAEDMMFGVEKIILWPLVFIAAPAMATLCFNLTRRYKKPASS